MGGRPRGPSPRDAAPGVFECVEPKGTERMSNGSSHAGDVTSEQAMEALRAEPGAVLVDVRTEAEWDGIGVPDLSSVGAQPVFIEWASAPAMTRNPDFADQLAAELALRGAGPETPLFFLCRSGARSAAAAAAMSARGYPRSHNVAGGFEGSPGAGLAGWRDTGLPWTRPGG